MEHEYTEGICGDGAAILRDGVMMPIEDIVETLNALQSERDEARAKLAALVPGKVRIPEPADSARLGFALSDGVISATLAWARTHAEVVVEAVVLPELTDAMLDEFCGESHAGNILRDAIRGGFRNGWNRLRAMQTRPAGEGVER